MLVLVRVRMTWVFRHYAAMSITAGNNACEMSLSGISDRGHFKLKDS